MEEYIGWWIRSCDCIFCFWSSFMCGGDYEHWARKSWDWDTEVECVRKLQYITPLEWSLDAYEKLEGWKRDRIHQWFNWHNVLVPVLVSDFFSTSLSTISSRFAQEKLINRLTKNYTQRWETVLVIETHFIGYWYVHICHKRTPAIGWNSLISSFTQLYVCTYCSSLG